MDIDSIREYLEVDSLGYLSIEGMLSLMPDHRISAADASMVNIRSIEDNHPVAEKHINGLQI